jgi:hypothetical protein
MPGFNKDITSKRFNMTNFKFIICFKKIIEFSVFSFKFSEVELKRENAGCYF